MISALVYILIAGVLVKALSIKDKIERVFAMILIFGIMSGYIIYLLVTKGQLDYITLFIEIALLGLYLHRWGSADFKRTETD